MEKVYYKVRNRLEYLRVLQLNPQERWRKRDYDYLKETIDRNGYVCMNGLGCEADGEIGWDEGGYYTSKPEYRLKPLYDFKEYLNQIKEHETH